MAHILGSAALGGAEAFYERLVPALAHAGEQVLPIIRADSGRSGRLRAAGVQPLQLPFGNYFDLVTRRRLSAALDGFAPQVVVAWQNRANEYAGKLRKAGAPWPVVGRLGGYYDLRYYRHCDHIVGNTRDLRRWFVEQGWPEDRAHYLPNFAHDLAGTAPARLPAPAGAPRLFALGRLHGNKGFDVLLRALALLPGVRLFIAGEGPEREALTRLARELGVAERATFLGWRTDTAALLAACDVFVCPSRHEPLGNVVLEAWSAARPVVAADAQGPSELIENGVTGLLVPKEEAEPLARAIAALLADAPHGAALAAAGRAAFERDYAEAPVLRRWRGFLHEIADGPGVQAGGGPGQERPPRRPAERIDSAGTSKDTCAA
jgi:glycosyltransferase involved in cell wall biosynthesis